MRKQDRIARERQQGRPHEPPRKMPPDEGSREQILDPAKREQITGRPTPTRPQRVPGKLPLPD